MDWFWRLDYYSSVVIKLWIPQFQDDDTAALLELEDTSGLAGMKNKDWGANCTSHVAPNYVQSFEKRSRPNIACIMDVGLVLSNWIAAPRVWTLLRLCTGVVVVHNAAHSCRISTTPQVKNFFFKWKSAFCQANVIEKSGTHTCSMLNYITALCFMSFFILNFWY